MQTHIHRYRDLLGGLLVALVGIFGLVKSQGYSVGTVSQMGPGFFPMAVSTLMILSGVALAVQNVRGREVEMAGPAAAEWKAWTLILLSIVAFIVLAEHTGLVIASFAVVFISALGDRDNRLIHCAALAAAITVVSVVVFWWALKVQIPLFKWSF